MLRCLVMLGLMLCTGAFAQEPTKPARRAAPPGTPAEYIDQRPAPPYSLWPEDAPKPFAERRACKAWFKDRVPTGRRLFIGRFDVVHRRCQATAEGWVYRESHAATLLDPVLEPALFAVPFGLWLGALGKQGTAADRGLERWGDTLGEPVGPPVGKWRQFGDWWVGIHGALSAGPLLTSSGNARLTDTIIMAEVMAMDLGIVRAASLRRGEPKPYVSTNLAEWSPQERALVHEALRGEEAWTSSPNLSTSVVAASSFGLATLGWIRSPRKRPVRVLVPFVLAAGSTVLQAVAEVQARRGDTGDVVVGAVTGASIGFLVPLSHLAISRTINPERRRRAAERKASRVAVQPVVSARGLGLSGVF